MNASLNGIVEEGMFVPQEEKKSKSLPEREKRYVLKRMCLVGKICLIFVER